MRQGDNISPYLLAFVMQLVAEETEDEPRNRNVKIIDLMYDDANGKMTLWNLKDIKSTSKKETSMLACANDSSFILKNRKDLISCSSIAKEEMEKWGLITHVVSADKKSKTDISCARCHEKSENGAGRQTKMRWPTMAFENKIPRSCSKNAERRRASKMRMLSHLRLMTQ